MDFLLCLELKKLVLRGRKAEVDAVCVYLKNLFFLEEFSIMNSFDLPFFPSRTIQTFSLVSAVSPVLTQISYSSRMRTWTQLAEFLYM